MKNKNLIINVFITIFALFYIYMFCFAITVFNTYAWLFIKIFSLLFIAIWIYLRLEYRKNPIVKKVVILYLAVIISLSVITVFVTNASNKADCSQKNEEITEIFSQYINDTDDVKVYSSVKNTSTIFKNGYDYMLKMRTYDSTPEHCSVKLNYNKFRMPFYADLYVKLLMLENKKYENREPEYLEEFINVDELYSSESVEVSVIKTMFSEIIIMKCGNRCITMSWGGFDNAWITERVATEILLGE